MTTIHLGFEVGTADRVDIPLNHMVITGQSQLAGKTTTLEALMSRLSKDVASLAFKTKRGERALSNATHVAPYFRERADWRFVQSVLEATLSQKLKFETAWIMRACKGADTLGQVQRNVKKFLETAKGLNENVYLTLDHYLDIVVPRISIIQFDHDLNLHGGSNVMDLSNDSSFPHEMQSLVIASTIEWIYRSATNTVTVIPEAWEFIPQKRGSPVKLSAIELIRKGANLGNFVWLDSQDLAGVDKEMLRLCQVWVMGAQREKNEIDRVLDNIPAGVYKPKAVDIQTLEKGQFFVCFGKHIIKTYVQPAWMRADDAIAIAKGQYGPESAIRVIPQSKPLTAFDERYLAAKAGIDLSDEPEEEMSKAVEAQLAELNAKFDRFLASPAVLQEKEPTTPPAIHGGGAGAADLESFYQYVKERLTREAPTLLAVLTVKSEIRVDERIETIEADATTMRGQIALLIVKGFFDNPVGSNPTTNKLKTVGYSYDPRSVLRELDNFTKLGFLTKGGEGFQVVAEMKRHIKR